MVEPQRPLPALADDLLEEILLRIASPADLARASAACAAFRRLIADRAFLRRYRALHPPLLLGFVDVSPEGFQPAEAPHPGAPAARALARDVDFSFGYIPPGREGRWCPCDARDGRVLLQSSTRSASYPGFVTQFPDLAVCDPVSRRYRLLPPIPDDLLAPVQVQEQKTRIFVFEALLLPSGDEEDETSFTVIGWTRCRTKSVVFVFSSGCGLWNSATSIDCDALGLRPYVPADPAQYAYGCFYWKLKRTNRLLKLDVVRMEFSTLDLPPDHETRLVAITEAGEGRIGMFSQDQHTSMDYYIFMHNDDGERANQWQMKNTIRPPASHYCYISDVAEGYVFLKGRSPKLEVGEVDCGVYFSLEIKTMEIKRFRGIRIPLCYVHPYFTFPPSMSPRRI